MNTQTHAKNNSHDDEPVESKKETKAEKANHELEAVRAELEAVKTERDKMAVRITAYEAFLNEAMRTATFNSTLAAEVLKPT